MSKKRFTSDEEQERQIRLEEFNLEKLPIIEKIKEMESKDVLNCNIDKCRCKTRTNSDKDSNKTYRQD